MVLNVNDIEELDSEWCALILEAKKQGLTIEEIRDFFLHAEFNQLQTIYLPKILIESR
ncbi:anti-repressor SinI family protein [Marinicrinis sediminis]|uniref:Anti-repressor SinI family protein n=1 Tax=Marinicrinis sediminis TaxID=1652465 RepID=A0ABW5R8B2_9BACL